MYLSLLKGRVMWAALAVVAMGVVLVLTASDVGVWAQQGPAGDLCSSRPCNSTPAFDRDTLNRSVSKNTPPGVNIGDPISATDPDEGDREYGDTLTYSLEARGDTAADRTAAASFDIDESTGQLITKAALDADSQPTGYVVSVRVKDSGGAEVAQLVTISVTDVDEAPLAPAAPTVVSGEDEDDGNNVAESTVSLKVVWHPPENSGRPNITDYDVEYKESAATAFTDIGHNSAATTATITGLKVDTSYNVRVRAENTDNDGPWSLMGTGSTNKEGNAAPKFTDSNATLELDVDENTPAGEDIENPVRAEDGDGLSLTYRLEGAHAGLFNFDTRSGQIKTKAPLNHESTACGYDDEADATTCTYRVTVVVFDRAGGSDAKAVNISVDDEDESPVAPARPTVRATDKSSRSLDVSWGEPENTGPPITDYNVEYRKVSIGSFSTNGVTVSGTTATIAPADNAGTTGMDERLTPNTSYEVRVKAMNAEGTSTWSALGTGKTARANHQPVFDDRPHSGDGSERSSTLTIARTMDENARAGQNVGRVVADDQDNDSLTYKLQASVDTDARPRRSRRGSRLTRRPVRYEPRRG